MTRNNIDAVVADTEGSDSEVHDSDVHDSEINDSEMRDSELPVHDSELPPEILAAGDNTAIEEALQQFVSALKHEFSRERERERAKIRQAYTEHVRKIEFQARKVVRERVAEAKNRNQKKLVEREKRINDLFRKVNLLARDIAHQKQVLKKSREEFDQKLMESDFIQTELRNIGQQMGQQVDSLGNSLLEEHFVDEFDSSAGGMQERKYG